VRHLVVDQSAPDALLSQSAAVILRRESDGEWPPLRQWSARQLDEYPGCRVAGSIDTEQNTADVRLRDGRMVHLALNPDALVDPAVLASVAYVATLLELVDDLRKATVRVGSQIATASVRTYGSSAG